MKLQRLFDSGFLNAFASGFAATLSVYCFFVEVRIGFGIFMFVMAVVNFVAGAYGAKSST